MSIARRIVDGAEFRSGLRNPEGWLYDALGGSKTYSGKKVTVENAMGLSPVFAAIQLISETIGMLPFKTFKDLGDGEVEEARQHRAWSMLHDKPNPATPAHRFWATVMVHLLGWGNVFIVKERGATLDNPSPLVEELYLLDPAEVEVLWNGVEKRFRIASDPSNNNYTTFDESQVLHIAGFSTDGVVGHSPIAMCRQSLGNALAREEFEGGFYERGAVHSGVLEHPDVIGQDGMKNLRQSWKQVYAGKTHEVVILEEGVKFRPLSIPLADLEFVAAQHMSRTDVATIFRIPPSYLGGSTGDSLTYATVEGNQMQFATLAVAPWTNLIAQAVSNDPGIFPLNIYRPEFVLEGLLRADTATRGTFYTSLYNIDAITPNEVRAKEPSLSGKIPGGDQTKTQATPKPVAPATPPAGPSPSGPAGGNGNAELTPEQQAQRRATVLMTGAASG